MRLVITILIVLGGLTSVCYSQQVQTLQSESLNAKVSISVALLPLDRVFMQLSEQTGFYFTYDASLVSGSKLITLKINNISLLEALDTLLQNHKISYKLVGNQVVIYLVDEQYVQVNDSLRYKYIRGKVIDVSTGRGLAFASISIKNCSFGVITNEMGKFTIKIPKVFFNDSLFFSYMGYSNRAYAVSDIKNYELVNLKKGIIPINEIIIRDTDPLILLSKVRKQINANYCTKPYGFKAFYREIVKKKSDYMFYSEAIIKGYKPSFLSSSTDVKVQLEQGRKFTNIQNGDTLKVKLRGGMDACFQLDITNQLPNFLTEEGGYMYEYSISDIVIWQNELAYVLDFKPLNDKSQFLFEGTVYISVNNFAVVRTDFSFSNIKIDKSGSMFVFRKSRRIMVMPVSTHYQVQYSQINGKYYVKHVRGELVIKVKKKHEVFRKDYTTIMEMVYTQTDTVNAEKPLRTNIIRTNTVFSDSDYLYNSNFWNNSNVISPEKDIMKAFRKSGFIINQKEAGEY